MSAGAGAQTLSYPSTQFPGPPSVTVQIPAEWIPVAVPGTRLAARRTATECRFAPNGVVRAGAQYPGTQRVMQTVRVTR
jgi:hypothetical protein